MIAFQWLELVKSQGELDFSTPDVPETKAWQITCTPRRQLQESFLDLRFKMADRPPSPTPSERKKLDAEAKAKELEEQSALPYKWTQQIGDLDLTAPIPGNLKGRDLDVKITKTTIKAGVKGQEPIIEVCLSISLPLW